MNAFGEQVGKQRIDRPLACNAALPLESGADDLDGEMRFALRMLAGMTGMVVAVVDDCEARRGEAFGKAAGDFAGDGACRFLVHPAYIGPMDHETNRRKGDRWHGRVPGGTAMCAHEGCPRPGEFRAPLGRGRPGWQWLCLDHVRAFNDSYNYFDGMSPDEIHEAQRPHAGWEPETRAFSSAAQASMGPRWSDFRDPLDALGARFRDFRPRPDGPPLSDQDRRLLKVMGLGPDADRRALRQRYAELVRRYHPDRNGGDRSFEKKLQEVIAAYAALKGRPAFA